MRRAIWLTLLACGVAIPIARAQGGLTQEARQAILDYQLTLPRANHLITAMEAMTRYVLSMPDHQERMAKAAKMTPAERREQVEKDPKAAAILKENDLTAQEYLVGVPALRMALLVAQGMPASGNIAASPANVAFAKANLAQLKAKMDAADGGVRPKK
jgi:hypothetical protein